MTVVLVGPTASGKSALAVALAERLIAAGRPAEIVNTDSMLVYRGMDIGTAKPSAAERAAVPHHLVDIYGIDRTATVAEFQELARAAIADCRSRSVLPILVGGSALYIRAIVDDFRFPGTDAALRAELEAELERTGPEPLHARLAEADPAAAAAIEPRNGRRIVRALEVIRLTGGPFQATLPAHTAVLPDLTMLGLDVDRPTLDRRIADRVRAMWQAGFVDEVRELAARGLRDGLTASRALGYRQMLAYLDGETDEAGAMEATITATRKFARRQDAWFRRDPRIRWLPYDAADLVPSALAAVEH
ncbi:tRNA (adenosine(37)-N6)-dimethylallyltransferase MiaA [Microlunatus sp. GCM10028923]|uniref:tRNA (adenosine(37)-N6)-dimethylallyltransferase MiaA n=1 Tax=Microlunatus sp. GCM10028923 TaxID=3273400 RepID=UPI003620394B